MTGTPESLGAADVGGADPAGHYASSTEPAVNQQSHNTSPRSADNLVAIEAELQALSMRGSQPPSPHVDRHEASCSQSTQPAASKQPLPPRRPVFDPSVGFRRSNILQHPHYVRPLPVPPHHPFAQPTLHWAGHLGPQEQILAMLIQERDNAVALRKQAEKEMERCIQEMQRKDHNLARVQAAAAHAIQEADIYTQLLPAGQSKPSVRLNKEAEGSFRTEPAAHGMQSQESGVLLDYSSHELIFRAKQLQSRLDTLDSCVTASMR